MSYQLTAVFNDGTVPVLNPVADLTALNALPETNLLTGAIAITLDTGDLYKYSGTAWELYYDASGAGFAHPYSAEVTWTGGAASFNHALAGVLASDRVQATVKQKGAQNVFSVRAECGAGQITFEAPVAVTGNDVVIAFDVFRG